MRKHKDNVVFMIGHKKNGSIFSPARCTFTNEINFGCFYPSKHQADEDYKDIFSGDSSLVVIETEIIEFKDNQLVVSFEDFSELPPL